MVIQTNIYIFINFIGQLIGLSIGQGHSVSVVSLSVDGSGGGGVCFGRLLVRVEEISCGSLRLAPLVEDDALLVEAYECAGGGPLTVALSR